jgi:MFS family permease
MEFRHDISAASPSTDRSPRWIHAVILLFTSALSVLVPVILGPNIPRLQQHFAAQIANVDQWIPMAVTIPVGVFGLCAIFIGRLTDRIGRKNVLVVSTLLYGIFGTIPFYVDNFWAIFASRVALGVFEAGLMTASTTLIGDYYAGVRRERMMSLQTTVASVAGAVFVGVGTAVGSLGWNAPFAIYAIALILPPLMAIYLWEPASRIASVPNVAAPDAQCTIEVTFKPRLLALICLLGFLTGIAFMVAPIHLAVVYTDRGWQGDIGIGYMLNSLGVVLGTFVFGWVLIGRVGVKGQLFASAALAGAGCLLMGYAGTPTKLAVGAAVNGLGCGLLLPTMVTWNMRTLPFARRGFGTGAFQSAFMLGMAFDSPIVVTLGNSLGHRALAITWIGIVLAGLAALALAVKVQRPGVVAPMGSGRL